jgi:ferredoxin
MSDFVEREISDLIIKIDRTTCIASKNCINAAPKLFELDDDRICSFKEKAEGIPKEVIIEACSVCPVSALQVNDQDGKQLVP